MKEEVWMTETGDLIVMVPPKFDTLLSRNNWQLSRFVAELFGGECLGEL